MNDFGSLPDNNSATSQLTFKLHNSGEAAASSLNFTNSNNTLFSIYSLSSPTPVCITNGSGTLAAGADCYYGVQFGAVAPATPPGTESNTTTVNYAWSSGGASASPSITQTMSGVVTTSTAATIGLSSAESSGFAGGDGTNGTPYQIQVNTPATLTYTYTNTGTQAANSFYVSNTTLSSGWTRSIASTCPATLGAAITLSNANGSNSCTVVFTINKGSSGTSNFNQNAMTAHWVDQANPGGIPQPAASNISYTNVYAAAVVTAVMSSSTTGSPTITNPTANTDFYIVYTLTGGYNVNMSYGVSFGGTAGTPAMQVKASTPTTCAVTTANPTCYITISSGGTATAQSITYSPVIPAITPTPASSGSFSVGSTPMYIFVTDGAWSGDLNGLSGADAKCNSDTAKNTLIVPLGTTWKALLSGNNATTESVVYRNESGAIIATATGGNLVGASSINNAINSSVSMAWTGEDGTNCSNWTINSSGSYGGVGQPDYTNAQWWQGGGDNCNNTYPLYCVQQPVQPQITATINGGADLTGGTCYPVTANIPAPATSNVWVTFTVSGTLTIGAAGFGNGAPQTTTNCAIPTGSSSCIGIDQFCSSPGAAGVLSIATSATGYQTGTTPVTIPAGP